MIAFLTPNRALEQLASNLQQRRLGLGLTQAGLSARAGVPLGTLKKFEQTGQASTEALMKLLIAVGAADATLKASEPETTAFTSINEVLESTPKPSRKRGWRT
ncbi:transcriptional regulator with XRE-family HTH domain [Brevundimonas vesicularis]|uniref:transcriptional regulator n=1 Tax=Brevundimonas vesicularis TaxID=41276 RepID=UPI0018EB18C7|nr:transcriptional regulator [Brevundimonas vesicularis]MDQ1193830.1 transcriptional regulator with XRE-family HTH domain [Brevundimonas vesicularis]